MKRLLPIFFLLPSCMVWRPDGQPGMQLGGQVALERWPDGHYRYTGDMTTSFHDATTAVTTVAGAVIAGNVSKALNASNNAADVAKLRSTNATTVDKALTANPPKTTILPPDGSTAVTAPAPNLIKP